MKMSIPAQLPGYATPSSWAGPGLDVAGTPADPISLVAPRVAAYSLIFIVPTGPFCIGAPGNIYGLKFIDGVTVHCPGYPSALDELIDCRYQAISEVLWTRALNGIDGNPPMLGAPALVVLPGHELAKARCLMLHRDGSWEGRILSETINDFSPEMVAMIRVRMSVAAPDCEVIPGRHGFRRDHVVRFTAASYPPCWVPAEAAGGLA